MKKYFVGLCFLSLFGCGGNHTSTESLTDKYQRGEELSIGDFSVDASDKMAFTKPLKGMDKSQKIDFMLGERLFNTNWVPAPASTTGLDGLGPTFNAKSCVRCHIRNGRGQPREKSTTQSLGFLMRISRSGKTPEGAPMPVEGYGGQLQDIGILQVNGEADVMVQYEIIKGSYADGTPYELRKPKFWLENPRYGDLPDDLMLSPRIGQQLIGMGFIDALSEQEILKNADEDDINNDGVSGRPNYVWNVKEQKATIGRFGWKANVATLEQQVAGAFHQDMGLTTQIFPEQNCPLPQTLCREMPNGNDKEGVEVSPKNLNDITFFLSSLAVPTRRRYKDEKVLKGKVLFSKLNCIACHRTGLEVSESKVFPAMNGTKINPYSDFLLHYMGDGLADNRPDYLAEGKEWRTQPLWGIGLLKEVNKHTFLLHDGRARSIEEAILWHGGEATYAREDFVKLSKADREALLEFVGSL